MPKLQRFTDGAETPWPVPEPEPMSLWKKLFGRSSNTVKSPAEGEAVHYKEFTIVPAPQQEQGQYRTAGRITRSCAADTVSPAPVSHFVRADNHATLEQAIQHSTRKAKQIIDERGEALFDSERC